MNDRYEDDDYFEYRYHYTIRINPINGDAENEELRDPWMTLSQNLLECLCDYDDLTLSVHKGNAHPAREYSRDEVYFVVDDGETGIIERPPNLTTREGVRDKLDSHGIQLSEPAAAGLASEFGSFEAILLADKEELMDVDGWGCNRYKKSERGIVTRFEKPLKTEI